MSILFFVRNQAEVGKEVGKTTDVVFLLNKEDILLGRAEEE